MVSADAKGRYQTAMETSRGRSFKQVMKQTVLLLGAMTLLQVVFFGLLVAGQAVPDKPIIENLAVSVEAGTYGPSGMPDRMGGVSDSFTECVVVGTGLGTDGMSAFDRAVVMPRISNCAIGKQQILDLSVGKGVVSGEYYKYWSGYTAFTRPVLATVGLEGLRMVSGFMLVASMFLAFNSIAKKSNAWVATALGVPLLLSSNIMSTPSTSFSQAVSVSFIFLGVACAAWSVGRRRIYMVGAVALGAALFCYVDLLTTPAIPWAFTSAVVAGLTFINTTSLNKSAVAGILAAVVWPLAFGFTWFARWVIAAVFIGWDEVTSFVQKNIEFRTSGEYGTVKDRLGAATLSNIHYWLDHVPTAGWVLVGSLLVVLVCLIVSVVRCGPHRILTAVTLMLPVLIVPVWYEVLSNHSQIHAFFVYRGIPAVLGIVLFASAVALPRRVVRRGTDAPHINVLEGLEE